jgi:PfaD family protein
MADDITVEADSGGHTDNRPLVCMIPSMLVLRDQIQAVRQYSVPVCIGAAGGISTPEATLAAFMMGAAYVVTGSVNQACVESGTSEPVRDLLAKAASTDISMAPAADMFEMGVRVQVLKRGTFFPQRAQKLYELYSRYNAIEDLPGDERQKLETQIFLRSLDDIWNETETFFAQRDPKQLQQAVADAHMKMALIFRWYLGLSSRWAVNGEKDREMDYQIWCGPAMGAFNDWVRGTYLESTQNRHVVDVAMQLLTGAAYLSRVRLMEISGVRLPADLSMYRVHS